MNKVLYTSKIDRCSELRTNSSFLNDIWKNSKFVPVWDKKLFIKNNEDIEALIINRVDLEPIFPNITWKCNFFRKSKWYFLFSINLCEKLNNIPLC